MPPKKEEPKQPSPSEVLVRALGNRKVDVGLHLTTIKDWFSTGCPMLDYVLRPGLPAEQRGLPGGKWIELYGVKHTGKSALAARILATMQQQYGAHGVWLLGEDGVETSFLQLCGVNLDPDYLTLARPFSLESLFICIENVVEQYHDQKRPFCVVVDSFSGLLAADYTMDEKSMKDGASRGAEAKAMHRGFRHGHLYYMNGAPIVAIGIRHQTANPDARFGPGDIRTHGSALDFHSWIQLKMTRKDFEDVWGGKEAGSYLTARVVKNKVGPLYGEVSMPFFCSHGWDAGAENLNFLSARNALPLGSAKGRYNIAGKNLFMGQYRDLYYQDPVIRQAIDQLVFDCLNAGVKGIPNVQALAPPVAPIQTGTSLPGLPPRGPLDGLLR